MRCGCGETEIQFTMTFGTPLLLPTEIALLHSSHRCTWAFECRDCWDTTHPVRSYTGGFMDGFYDELEAAGALLMHLTGRDHPMNGRTILGCHLSAPTRTHHVPSL